MALFHHQHQLSRLELYDTTIMPPPSLMACIVYLFLLYFFIIRLDEGWWVWRVSLQWNPVFLLGSRHHLIFESPVFTLAHPTFLLAGQALYYPGKSLCVCICVFVHRVNFQALAAHRQTCRCRDAEWWREEEGTSSRKLCLIVFPSFQKSNQGPRGFPHTPSSSPSSAVQSLSPSLM